MYDKCAWEMELNNYKGEKGRLMTCNWMSMKLLQTTEHIFMVAKNRKPHNLGYVLMSILGPVSGGLDTSLPLPPSLMPLRPLPLLMMTILWDVYGHLVGKLILFHGFDTSCDPVYSGAIPSQKVFGFIIGK